MTDRPDGQPGSANAGAPQGVKIATGEQGPIREFGATGNPHKKAPVGLAGLLGVLGVVYGDIGTSRFMPFRPRSRSSVRSVTLRNAGKSWASKA